MTALPPEWTAGRFRCPVCPKGFHTLSAKKQHVKVKHPKPVAKR